MLKALVACKNSWFQATRSWIESRSRECWRLSFCVCPQGALWAHDWETYEERGKKQWLYTFWKYEKKNPTGLNHSAITEDGAVVIGRRYIKKMNLRTKDVTNVWHREDNEDTQTGVWDWRNLFIFRSVVLSSLYFVCAMMSLSRRFNQNSRILHLLLLSFGPTLCTGESFTGLYHDR